MTLQLRYKSALCFAILFLISCGICAQDTSVVINITQLYPVKVNAIFRPTTTAEIVNAVKNNPGPISIGGGRYSMGGQTATQQALQIDMRGFDKILSFSKKNKEITVQAGMTWHKLLAFIDTTGLSVRIMQSYGNFTVGGSLSVNAHGRYISEGPIILSVKKIKVVLANGDVVEAGPTENGELFYGAIGGYGGLGVITEATLLLTDNAKVERTDTLIAAAQYKNYFFDKVKNNPEVIFHNGDLYPNQYNKVRAITYKRTTKPVTAPYRLHALKDNYGFNKFIYGIVSEHPLGKWTRQHIIDPFSRKHQVEWRNYEAAAHVEELEPRSRQHTTYVLAEYFLPVENFDSFYPAMAAILKRNHVNVINISIRYAGADPGSLLAWARTPVFSFVIYYKQGTSAADNEKVKGWTRELIDAAIANKGSYYLPYQIHATSQQFAKAYPNSIKFFQLKKHLDPTNKFRNKLWDEYYK